MTSRATNDVKWLFKVHHMCTVLLYVVFQLCLFMNLYVLLSREDTIFYLRIYHSVSRLNSSMVARIIAFTYISLQIIGLLMFCCGIVQLEFLIRTRDLPKLEEPHEIPGPALIGMLENSVFLWSLHHTLLYRCSGLNDWHSTGLSVLHNFQLCVSGAVLFLKIDIGVTRRFS